MKIACVCVCVHACARARVCVYVQMAIVGNSFFQATRDLSLPYLDSGLLVHDSSSSLSLHSYLGVFRIEITNKMRPCSRIYYSNVSELFNMFRATHRSSSGAQKL